MSNISKVAKTKMEITADYQKLSDLNVAFYNQDINTSILQFNVTRNDAVVPLGKSNVDGYIVLVHADGSRIQDNLVIVNEEHGVIQYTIPREFLKHTGKVLGQVYIAVKGRDDTAVMRKISFEIKQDLMTAFSSTKKLEYIKTFDDLQTQIKQRVKAIEEEIANGTDYVTAMEKAAEKGRKDIQAVATKATTDVNKTATDATKKITDTSNTAVATVNAKGDEVLKKLTDGDVVQKKDYYPLIGGTGTRERLVDGTDLLTLTTGYYEVSKCKNSPFPDTAASWKNVDVIDGGEGRKMLRLTVSSVGATFYKTLHTNGDGGRDWWRVADIDVTQNSKITEDNGQFYYNLSDNEADILASVASESGFKTGYAHFTALNGLSNNRSFSFTSYYYPTNGYIHAIDTAGQSHIRVCNGGVWGAWKSLADTSVTQNFKITNDDGSSITLSGFDLLNVEDVKNYDGYVTNPKNAPSSSGSGYFKRKYRDGYIEITFAPHSTKDIYRNSYNGGTKKWVGWEKMVTSSELASVIGSNTGWLPLPLLNGVTASTPCFYRFYSTNGIYYLSFKGVLNTLPTRDVIIAKLPADVATKIDRPLTFVGNTSASANAARFNRWVVEMDGKIKFATSNFGTDGESGAWNPLDVTLTL